MNADSDRALEAVLKLAALEERTSALKTQLERIEGQLGRLLDRLAHLEARDPGPRPVAEPDDLSAEQSATADADQPSPRPFLTSYSEE